MAPDLRGWGETADSQTKVLTPHYSIAMRAMLVGQSIPGMQVTDLLSAFDVLAAGAEVDPGRISIFAEGNAVAVALFAAALEPKILQVACEGGPVSFLDIVKKRLHGEIADLVVPGILKQFDLPEIAASLAPRKLWLANPHMPSGAAEPISDAAAEYKRAQNAYQRLGAPNRFRIIQRPEDWSFATVYADWLSE